jgi:hypothetical protein
MDCNETTTKENTIMFSQTGLRIVVKNDRWEAFGDPANPWHSFLYKRLAAMGGVNESVPEGEHIYNITEDEEGQLIESLLPAQ